MQVETLLKLSVAAAAATIVMKTMARWITDSVGLPSDAMKSFVNLASALFGLAMVNTAQRPADDDHPFGHSKVEDFSSGFEGLLIAGAAAGIDAAPLAIGVALNILREGARLAWRSVEGLMESALEPEVRAQIDRTRADSAHHAIRFDQARDDERAKSTA